MVKDGLTKSVWWKRVFFSSFYYFLYDKSKGGRKNSEVTNYWNLSYKQVFVKQITDSVFPLNRYCQAWLIIQQHVVFVSYSYRKLLLSSITIQRVNVIFVIRLFNIANSILHQRNYPRCCSSLSIDRFDRIKSNCNKFRAWKFQKAPNTAKHFLLKRRADFFRRCR